MVKIYPMPGRPADSDPLDVKAAWLVQTHGFDARAGQVVMLYEPSASCVMTLQSFQVEYAAWSELQPRMGARGPLAPKLVLATDLWARSSRRISVAGVRMRPDKNFPIYASDDNSEVFKNTYRRPIHVDDGSGDVQPFLRFFERFLPDDIERNWMLDWMTHKWRRPDVPGTSPWLVADIDGGPLGGKFGVGRGMMGRILAKLYGEAYCKAEDFDILTGQSGQAAYTDWQAYSILVMVDEAHSSPTAYRRGEKRSVYTALKSCIDPAPKRRMFKVKGGQAFDGISYCSIVVATNHANAAAIPANDRRITVLRNGREMTPDEAIEIDAWMQQPANIAALADYLESAGELAGFNMFQPLKTAAKDEMADLSLNEVENALIDFASEDDRGLVFPRLFLEREVEAQICGDGERVGRRDNAWQGQLAGAFDEHCVKVKLSNGRDRARIMVSKRRYSLYCFRKNQAAAQALTETERREHAARWGSIDDIQTVLRTVKKESE
jgi:hypothetical protein